MAIRMFGPLRVEVGDQVLGPRDFGGVKPKQLLEILLLERGRIVPKDRIADQLWDEHLPQRITATIETYVSLLRRRLDAGSGPHRSRIITEHGGYRLPTDDLQVDIDRFDGLIRQAARVDLGERRSLLVRAVAYCDEDLLGDEPYAKWTQAPREHYRAVLVHALLDLAESHLQLDDHQAALAAVERVLTYEPTSERAYRVGMMAHHALGSRDEALRMHTRCRFALSDTLGIDPTPQIAQLHVAILRGEDPVTALGHHPSRERAWLNQVRATPPVRYADNNGVRIAHQLIGDGPVDLVFVPSFITNLAATWDEPTYASFLRGLASVSRLILFDKRGTGLSDPALDFPTQRERSEDLLSVLDSADSQRAVLFGVCGGGGMCVQFATDHPDRTAGLILHNSTARVLCSDDYPWGMPGELYERFLDSFEEIWLDESDRIAMRNPGLVDNPRYRDWYAHYVRLASNPFMARRLAEMNTAVDNRQLLPLITSPSLVITRTEDAWMSPENSRYLAEHISGAQLLELPGVDHDPWVGDTEPVLQAVREFLHAINHRSDQAPSIPIPRPLQPNS
jgi:pimeloyl-ACP methyl ester carboxylesterase/DNA-binding SARP family transcriptional activator